MTDQSETFEQIAERAINTRRVVSKGDMQEHMQCKLFKSDKIPYAYVAVPDDGNVERVKAMLPNSWPLTLQVTVVATMEEANQLGIIVPRTKVKGAVINWIILPSMSASSSTVPDALEIVRRDVKVFDVYGIGVTLHLLQSIPIDQTEMELVDDEIVVDIPIYDYFLTKYSPTNLVIYAHDPATGLLEDMMEK